MSNIASSVLFAAYFPQKDGHLHFVYFLPRAGASRASGAFAVYKGEEPELGGSIRLRLATVDTGTPLVAHLSAMVVKHGIFF